MIFWDTSAIVPLLVEEDRSRQTKHFYSQNPDMIVWWGTILECVSAIARLERENFLDSASADKAYSLLQSLKQNWHEIVPTEKVRETAKRLLKVHTLKTADALQLAAAIVASGDNTAQLQFCSFDENLVKAGKKEGVQLVVF